MEPREVEPSTSRPVSGRGVVSILGRSTWRTRRTRWARRRGRGIGGRRRRGGDPRGARARLGRGAARCRRARRARRDAPLDRARHGRGRPRPVPGHQARHRAGDRRRLLLRLRAARPLTPDDLASIEARMRESVAADHPFVRKEVRVRRRPGGRRGQRPVLQGRDPRRPRRARRRRPGRRRPSITFYEHGPFSDLCKGPHVAATGKIGPFKLLSVAGAYWRGDAKRPALQRIYGTVWPDQDGAGRSSCGAAPRRRSATTAGSACSSTCSASTT